MRARLIIVLTAIMCLSLTSGYAQEKTKQWNCFQKIHEKALTTAVALTPTRLRYALIPFYDSMIDEIYKTDYKPTAYQDKKVFDNLYEAAVFEAHKRDDLKKDYLSRLMTDLSMYIVQKYYPGRLGGFCEEWTFLRYAPVFYAGYDEGDKKPDFTRYAPVIYGGYEKKPLYLKFQNVFFSDNHTDTSIRYTGDMLWFYNKAVNEIVNLWISVWKDADRNAESVIETYTLVNPEDVTPFNHKEPQIYERREDLGLLYDELKNKPETVPLLGYRAVFEMRDDEGMFVMWENGTAPENYTEIYDIRNRRGFFVFRQRYSLIKPLRVFSSMRNSADYAFNAIENKKYYEAAAILSTLIDRKSRDPEMYYGLGVALFNIDDYVNSLINFDKAGQFGASLYYVGLINEYLSLKSSSFDSKVSLLVDSARAYEKYGNTKGDPEFVDKSKSITIKSIQLFEREVEAAISEALTASIEAENMYGDVKTASIEKGLEKSVKGTRLTAQAGFERVLDLFDRYQSAVDELNAKFPNSYALKNYNQAIDEIEDHLNAAIGIDTEIAVGQENIRLEQERNAARDVRLQASCRKQCGQDALDAGLNLNKTYWYKTLNGRGFLNCLLGCR